MRRPVLAGVLAVCAALTPAACSSSSAAPSCDAPTEATSVELQDFAFAPDCIAAPATATLTLENTGSATHTFTIDGTPVNANVNAGDTATVTLSGLTAGTTYRVICTYHTQMVAALEAT
jgi:plastocyanin